MPQLIIHDQLICREELEGLRLRRTLALSPRARMKTTFKLMAFALKFKKSTLTQIPKDTFVFKKQG